MARIAIGGFQHETNTFAPSPADYAAFEAGGGWPGVQYGEPLFGAVAGANIPAAGAIDALRAAGHQLVGTAWAAASPSAAVTSDAFERIGGEIVRRLKEALPMDGVYLDLHGAMVTERFDDGEGELLRRVRVTVGPRVPVAVSLDLHCNFTRAMFEHADAFVAYRTYPHVDMADTGARAAQLLDQMLRGGARLAGAWRSFDYLTGIPSQCSFIEPCKGIYADMAMLERKHDAVLSFTPGFPMADFAECGMAVFGYGPDAKNVEQAVEELRGRVADAEKDFALELHEPDAAVARARQRAGAPGGARRHAGQSGGGRQRRYDGIAARAGSPARRGGRARVAHRQGRRGEGARGGAGRDARLFARRQVARAGDAPSRASSRWRSSATANSPAPGRCSRAFA
jgi:microcystin degradation protein MlrC